MEIQGKRFPNGAPRVPLPPVAVHINPLTADALEVLPAASGPHEVQTSSMVSNPPPPADAPGHTLDVCRMTTVPLSNSSSASCGMRARNALRVMAFPNVPLKLSADFRTFAGISDQYTDSITTSPSALTRAHAWESTIANHGLARRETVLEREWQLHCPLRHVSSLVMLDVDD